MVAQVQLGVVAARNRVDLEALGLEVVAEQQGERLLVFHDQNACWHGPFSAFLPSAIRFDGDVGGVELGTTV